MCVAENEDRRNKPCEAVLVIGSSNTAYKNVCRAIELLRAKKAVSRVQTWTEAKAFVQRHGSNMLVVIDLRSLEENERMQALIRLEKQGIEGAKVFLYDSKRAFTLMENDWSNDVFVLCSLDVAYIKSVIGFFM